VIDMLTLVECLLAVPGRFKFGISSSFALEGYSH